MTNLIIYIYGAIAFGVFSMLFIGEIYFILKFLKLSEEAWNIMLKKND